MQQGSFRFPDNCPDADCDFLVTYQVSNDDNEKVVFDLRGRGNWAGVGFSGDQQMVSNLNLQNSTLERLHWDTDLSRSSLGIKAWIKVVLGTYDSLAISPARIPRTK